MKLSYYPGCTLKNHARNFEDSTLFAMGRLGVEAVELKRWNCCGTVYSLSADDLMRQVAPIRNLLRARESGHDRLMTGCAMCFNTLKRANNRVRSRPEDLERMNAFMYDEPLDYRGDVDVLHVLEVVRDQIGFDALRKQVVRPLEGLKVACYYGCLLVRPREVGIDDCENPTLLENLVTALGGEPVDFSHKTECCAAYQTLDKPEIVADRTYQILGAARGQGADLVAVSCPLCAFNLDQRQDLTLKRHPDFLGLPVMYFSQLMALALGGGEPELRLDFHHNPPGPLLAGKGLL
ncbi:MAG: CoB--CoM heterodisulfide reductase iron-sulfur subunit B family protein [Gammaproteobacteria bacterium]|nr:CoB--CoM heterodisulfide reductase iron-sulfur subunit B family protein [Gammaproteobacteria bacterium]MBU1655960.1 CoB--CoM heterodisulfide reductase iron-sulfur subunit B family protein [Gammaproteobacteria bacterium]MBU1962472.1 CoB--CoM heterodisulfide reductase iron-sulfur subunit B family protein [Gammaproteobacteria bacterium]